MKRDALAFVDHVREACASASVRLKLEARDFTPDGDLGSFDDIKGVLQVCVNDARWLTTLAHEYAHLCQWLEKSPYYKSESKAEEDFDAWLSGTKRVSAMRLVSIVRSIQKVELDAERRTVRLIKRFRLTNVEAYIQRANFYVWQYEAARKLGRWIEDQVDLTKQMPVRLMPQSHIGKLPSDFGVAL